MKISLHLVPRSLQYIEQVAQLGSIQAASRKLGISASAIHRQIKSLEDDVGAILFERDGKGMTLTTSGRLVLDLARDWRLDNARLWTMIQDNEGNERGQIRIAAMDSMVNGFIPEMVQEIERLYPLIKVDINITSPDGATKGVLNGEFDLAVVANVTSHNNLKFHWSREFPLGCIAIPEHPVASKDRICFSEFVSHPVVFQSAELTIRKLLEARHGWIFDRVTKSTTVNSVQLMKLLVLSGHYIAVTSELDAGPEIQSNRLKFIPISDKDTFKQCISLTSNKLIPETATTQKITSIAVRLLEDLTHFKS